MKCDSKTQTRMSKVAVIKIREDAKSRNFHLIIILFRCNFLYKIREKRISKHSILMLIFGKLLQKMQRIVGSIF